MRYVRDAIRSFVRAPGLALAAVVCITLGSAAATAVATLVEAALLRPVPFPQPERLTRVWLDEAGVDSRVSLSIPEAKELQSAGAFDSVLITARVRAVVLFRTGAERLRGEAVNDGYFDTLGIRPAHGRLLESEDHQAGATPAMVLSYGTWMRVFGGDITVIGATVRSERASYTVVGIAPRTFPGTVEQDVVDFWTALDHYEPASMVRDRMTRQTWTIARLGTDVSITAAQARLDAVQAQWSAAHPDVYRVRRLRIEPFGESWRGEYRRGVGVMAVAAVVLLTIAAMNVGCLLVARVLERRRELAVRAALGADRWRIAVMLFSEALIVAVAGGAAGLLGGPALLDLFMAASPVDLPTYIDIRPDAQSLGAAVFALALAGLVAGTVPALIGGRVGPGEILKETGRGGDAGSTERRWLGLLIAGEIALTLTLLVSGGLLLRAYERFAELDLGYRREGIARLAVTFSRADAGEPAARAQVFERIRAALGAYPGVERVGLVAVTLPPWNAYRIRARFADLDTTTAPEGLEVGIHMSDHELFPALGIDIIAGRNFVAADTDRIAIVSRSLADRMGGVTRVVGRDVEFPGTEAGMPSGAFRVVGVAEDVAYDGIGEQGTGRHIHYASPLDAGQRLDAYVPLALFPVTTVSIAAFTRGDAAALIDPLRREIAKVAPTSAVHWTSTMADEVGIEYAPTRFYALLVAAFSASALALTSVGLFALLSHAAARRASEMGLRLALGATPRQVAVLLLRGGARPVIAGAGIGLLGASWASASMRGLLYDLGSFDVRAFAGAFAALVTVAVTASLIPARRVASVDPVCVMKGE